MHGAAAHPPQQLPQARPPWRGPGLPPDIHLQRSKHPGHPSNIHQLFKYQNQVLVEAMKGT